MRKIKNECKNETQVTGRLKGMDVWQEKEVKMWLRSKDGASGKIG